MANLKESNTIPFQPSLRVNTLDTRVNSELETLLTEKKLVLSDIDYTLIDISQGHAAGVQAIAGITSPAVAQQFDAIFHLIVEGHILPESSPWSDRNDFNHIMQRMTQLQSTIVPEWGLKYWSKECMLMMSAQDVRENLSAEDVRRARDGYWQSRAEKSTSYQYSQSFSNYLDEHNIPLVLFTSGYSILQIADDLSLSYDPVYSESYKRRSIEPHISKTVKKVVIGDPIDKPDPRFYSKVLTEVRQVLDTQNNQPISFNDIVTIGDSVRNDLEYLGNLGSDTILVEHK